MTNLFKKMAVLMLALSISACGIFGGDKSDKNMRPKTTAIGVNGYLWQGTLDTLDFMSVSESNPGGGMIVTEWYTDPNSTDERVKVTVRFLTEELRADGLAVVVVRQKNQGGTWVNQPVNADTGLQIQDAILLAARNLKQGLRD